MAPVGIAICDSRILKWVSVAAFGLTILSATTLAIHIAWGVALAVALLAPLIWIKQRTAVAQIRVFDRGNCELIHVWSNQPVPAALHSSFEAFGLTILMFRGSFPALLVLAPDSIGSEPRRLLGMWLRSGIESANSAPARMS